MRLAQQIWRGFSTGKLGSALSNAYRQNKNRNAVHVQNPELHWSFKDLELHSNAVAYGLADMGFNSGDKVAVWLDKGHVIESLVLQIGAAKAGVTVVPCGHAKDEKSLSSILQATQAKALVFSPNAKEADKKRLQIVQSVFPELATPLRTGSPLKLQGFPSLKHIFSVGFYTYPGTMKFRNMLVYGNKNFMTRRLDADDKSVVYELADGQGTRQVTQEEVLSVHNEFRSRNKLGDSENIIFAGDLSNPLAFTHGVLNNSNNGNFLILPGNTDILEAAKLFKHQNASVLVLDEEATKKVDQINPDDLSTIKQIVTATRERPTLNLGGKFAGNVSHYNPFQLKSSS